MHETVVEGITFHFSEVQRTEKTLWLLNAKRESDNHWLWGQMWFDSEPNDDERTEAISAWLIEHPEALVAPVPVHCISCKVQLLSDADTDYQFDNALWIGFHGGYGMFVDNLEAKLPTNTEEAYIEVDGNIERDPNWQPHYREHHVLTGADYEAVICHDCAHGLCDQIPWIGDLLNPLSSHAHRDDYHKTNPDHVGWDTIRYP